MTNPEWGTKRNCPNCSAHFYDLNKVPVTCPKCQHHFDPAALARGRKKPVKREQIEKSTPLPSSVLAGKKSAPVKASTPRDSDEEGTGDDIASIAEIDDVDDIESLKELSELEEMESTPVNEDDADEEAIIDDLEAGDKAIIGDIEEEEAKALQEDGLDEEETSPPTSNPKPKYPLSHES